MTFYIYATLMITSLLGAIGAGAEDQGLLAIVLFSAFLGWFAALVEMDYTHNRESDDANNIHKQ